MGVMLKSKKTAEDFSGYIVKFAKTTPYHVEELGELAKGLLQYDIPLDQTKTLMNEMGDIALGNSEKMQRLGYVLGLTAAQGHLSGLELREFNHAAFNPLKELANMTGVSYAKLFKMMSQNKITFDMVQAAMKHATSEGGKFYKGMELGSKTLSGRWSTAMDNVFISLGEAVEKNADRLNGIIERIGTCNFDGLVESLAELSKGFIEVLDKGEKLLELVSKIPNVVGLAGAALIGLKLKTFAAASGFGTMAASVEKASDKMLKFSKAGAVAAGIGGLISGATAPGAGNGSITGTLGSVASGALAGGMIGGVHGALIGAATSSIYNAFQSIRGSWNENMDQIKTMKGITEGNNYANVMAEYGRQMRTARASGDTAAVAKISAEMAHAREVWTGNKPGQGSPAAASPADDIQKTIAEIERNSKDTSEATKATAKNTQKVKIDERGLQLLTEYATYQWSRNYNVMRNSTNIRFTGPIHQTADVDAITKRVEKNMTDSYNTLMAGA
jgi:hypothetical protein